MKRSKKSKKLSTIQEGGGGEIIYINWPIINDEGKKIPYF